MDNDVSLHDRVESFVASLTSPRSSKTESGCKRYAHFRIAVSAVFQWGGSSGRCPRSSGPYFLLSFSAKSFAFFSRVGVRNFARKFAPEISGAPEVPALCPGISGPRKFWLSPLRFLLGWGSGTLHRRFAPEISGAPEVPV